MTDFHNWHVSRTILAGRVCMTTVPERRTVQRVTAMFTPLTRQQIGLVRCRYPQALPDFIDILPAFLELCPEEQIEDWLRFFSGFTLQNRLIFTCYLRQSVGILEAGQPLEKLPVWIDLANRFVEEEPEEALTLLRATGHLYGVFGRTGCESVMKQYERVRQAHRSGAAIYAEALASLPRAISIEALAEWTGTLIEHLPDLLSLKADLQLFFLLFSHRVIANEGLRIIPAIAKVLACLPQLDRWTSWLLLEKLSRWSVLFSARSIERWCDLFVEKIYPCHDIGPLFLALTDQMWRCTTPDLVCRIFSAMPYDKNSSNVRKHNMELVAEILDTRPELFACALFMDSILRLSSACHQLACSFYQSYLEDSQGRFGDISPEKLSALLSRGLKLYRREGFGSARRFISLESDEGVQFFMDLYGGYRLDSAIRRLGFYQVGISGRTEMALCSAGEFGEENDKRFIFCTDGNTVYLPESIGIFPRDELNYLVYKTGLSHEIGHIEFGSFGLDLEKIREVLVFLERMYYQDSDRFWEQQVKAAFIRLEKEDRGEELSDFERFFLWFPCRRVAVEIFNLVEDTRIDTILCRTYSGLEDDFTWINDLVWPKRPSLASLDPLGQVLEVLLQREYWGRTRDPVAPRIAAFADRMRPFIEKVKRPGATVEDAAWATAHMYVMLDEFLGPDMYEPDGLQIVVRLPYRGEHFPESVRKRRRDIMSFTPRTGRAGDWSRFIVDTSACGKEGGDSKQESHDRSGRQKNRNPPGEDRREDVKSRHKGKKNKSNRDFTGGKEKRGTSGEQNKKEQHDRKEQRGNRESQKNKQEGSSCETDRKPLSTIYKYDEWDGARNLYLREHCTVRDEVLPSNLRVRTSILREIEQGLMQLPGPDDDTGENGIILVGVPAIRVYETVMKKYGGYVKDLKTRMAFLKPEAMRLSRGYEDGEVLDTERALEMAVDASRGIVPDDRVFRRLVRKDRSIALLVLVDMSHSTGDRTPKGRSIILVELEALVLLSEAVDALQDTCAIYGFSSLGPDVVNLLRIKGFEESLGPDVKGRIGGLKPMSSTRMGAAIRHAAHLLSLREEKTKILLVLTDGWPYYYEQDCQGYAHDDTARAVREARDNRIHTICVSIDGQEIAERYLPTIFGQGNYRIIMQPEQLPLHLAELYRQLTR